MTTPAQLAAISEQLSGAVPEHTRRKALTALAAGDPDRALVALGVPSLALDASSPIDDDDDPAAPIDDDDDGDDFDEHPEFDIGDDDDEIGAAELVHQFAMSTEPIGDGTPRVMQPPPGGSWQVRETMLCEVPNQHGAKSMAVVVLWSRLVEEEEAEPAPEPAPLRAVPSLVPASLAPTGETLTGAAAGLPVPGSTARVVAGGAAAVRVVDRGVQPIPADMRPPPAEVVETQAAPKREEGTKAGPTVIDTEGETATEPQTSK